MKLNKKRQNMHLFVQSKKNLVKLVGVKLIQTKNINKSKLFLALGKTVKNYA